MTALLKLPVVFNDEEFVFDIEMINWTYTHRFQVHVEEDVYFFEPDEEGNYRALVETGGGGEIRRLPLLKEIGATLSQLMNDI